MAGHHLGRKLLGVGLAGLLGFAGCGKPSDPGSGETQPAAPPAAIPNGAAQPIDNTPFTPKELSPIPTPRLDVPFADVTTTVPYSGSIPAPTTTITGQSTAKIQSAVREVWPTIKVTDEAGTPSPIVVAIETEAGPVELTLFPDLAPNHVRNFLALAQIGYYNGLFFERIIKVEYDAENGTKKKLEVLTAGCPAGDGESNHSHLGYFLKPETRSLTHEEGVIGFVCEKDENSACCRLYFCMTPAAVMDGEFSGFGRVTKGMDILKAAAMRPVKKTDTYPENEQFQQPLKIKSVTRK
jgi:peptidyl-prolyl cis-trans isomerase B (cyclophilin B)